MPTHEQRAPRARAAFAAALIAACGVALAACDEGERPQGRAVAAAIEVEATRPSEAEFPRYVRVTGTLYGDEETTISAKVSGRVVETVVDLGDAAEAGDVLVRIDPIDYELARNERLNALAQALARLGLDALPDAGFEVDSLPAVERARLQAENARSRYERGRQLAERTPPLISEQDFADLRTTWEVAESNLRVEMLVAESTLAEARTLESQRMIAEQRIADTTHRAPSSPGSARRSYSVAAKLVSVGDFVQVGAPLVRLVDQDPVKLRASVPERRVGVVRTGQPALVRLEAFSEPFGGEVSRVSPSVDPATRAFPVEVVVPNPDRALKPGSFATCDIEVAREAVTVVPESCIVTFAGVHKVVLVRDGAAVEQQVRLGERLGEFVEVTSGLDRADLVVVRPPGSLVTGTPVRVRDGGAGVSMSGEGP